MTENELEDPTDQAWLFPKGAVVGTTSSGRVERWGRVSSRGLRPDTKHNQNITR